MSLIDIPKRTDFIQLIVPGSTEAKLFEQVVKLPNGERDPLIGLPNQFIGGPTFLKKIGGEVTFSPDGSFIEIKFPHPKLKSISLVRTIENGTTLYFIKNELSDSIEPLENHQVKGTCDFRYNNRGLDIEIGKPYPHELLQIPEVQRAGFKYDSLVPCYPTGLHSTIDSYTLLGTSLVARIVELNTTRIIGILIGFYKRDGGIESQVMTVLDEYRQHHVAFNLKAQQFRDAIAGGITKITQTYDPLLAANAGLNINALGGRIVDYSNALYTFVTNKPSVPEDRATVEYNLVSGSPSIRVSETRSKFEESKPIIPRNSIKIGFPGLLDKTIITPTATLAIEIPKDWPAIRNNPDSKLAIEWRNWSRLVFSEVLKSHHVNALAFDGNIPYLIANPNE